MTGFDIIANHDVDVARNLYVCTDTGIGGVIVGTVISGMTSGDIGAANNIVADGEIHSGSLGQNGGIIVRSSSNTATFSVAGSSGQVTTDGGISADDPIYSGASGSNGGLYVRNSAGTTTFSVGSSGEVTPSGDVNMSSGYGVDFLTNSGYLWQIYGSSAAGSNQLRLIGPSSGELLIDATNMVMQIGNSSADTLIIPATIDQGIIVKDNIGGGADACAIRAENEAANGIAITGRVTSTDSCAVLINKGTGDIVKGFSGATGGSLVFEVSNAGRVTCAELEITGGADVAEPFKVSGTDAKPGMVMSIDPKQAGQLRICTTAYDPRVAGIVSGANGVKPGVTMKHEGSVADGTLPVALNGRVWCWCDASNGAIEPGDLLTTSSLPGHAMKVTDHSRANGAAIGKAMTELNSGRGLVLVLVNLQ